jgi:hypothetical protein
LSTPELVRVSDMNAMPLSNNIPTQYVILTRKAPALIYSSLLFDAQGYNHAFVARAK